MKHEAVASGVDLARLVEPALRKGCSLLIENVEIQIQDHSGTWRTVHTTQNQSQQILLNMKSIQSRYPDKRVRAVDKSGRLIDLLD